MCNIYITSEPEFKLKQVFSNLKNFYILDVNEFVESLNVDLTKQSGVYLVNSEIEKLILSQAKLKKYQGVIYINKNISQKLHDFLKQRFKKSKIINKLILIDNGEFPKHQELMGIFEEVLFYERFRKTKIIECQGFEAPINDNIVGNDNLSTLIESIIQ